MRTRLLTSITVTALCAAVAGLGQSAPALAQGGLPAARHAGAAGGPAFSHFAYSQVQVTGDVNPGALGSPAAYTPAPCWVEPRFTGSNSYHAGDPQPSATGDADSYWWWFVGQEPALAGVLGRIQGLKQAVNKVFKARQGGAGWWWVPSWINAGVSGYACAWGLVHMLNLRAQYLEYLMPQRGGPATPGHPIDGQILADLARAELALPAIKIFTNPAAGKPSDVNLPVWVWVDYAGPRQPTDTASVPLPDGTTLSATVTTSPPQVSVAVSTSAAHLYNNCGATGSRYTGNATAAPPCGVTFLAPSTGGPYTITVTARWTVRWSDSTGESGTFASPPWPVPAQTGTTTVTVREIQAINEMAPDRAQTMTARRFAAGPASPGRGGRDHAW